MAISTQVPVPLDMVTVAVALVAVPEMLPTEQTPAVTAIVGVALALVVAVTAKVPR